MTQPASNPSDGMLKVVYVPTLADPTAPTQTELRAGTVIDLSCYLTGDGFTTGTNETAAVDERLCSVQTFEQPGRYTDTLDVKYIYRQQEPSSASNKAYTTLKRLTVGYAVSRYGIPYATDLTTGDVVDVTPIKCGQQIKMPRADNEVFKVQQKLFITGVVQRDVAVV
jgi:hypothetical protein